MCHEQLALLKEIQALEFTCVDLNLFLDTHPGDERALTDYNTSVGQLACAKTVYTQRYGALTHFGWEAVSYPWSWIDEPWPWEIEY